MNPKRRRGGPTVEYLVFAIVVVGIAVVGIRVGMLLAPGIDRLTESDDEEPSD